MNAHKEDVLPITWVLAPMSALAADEPNAITDGPFGSNLKTRHYTDSGPRVIRLQNIGDGVFIDSRAHISRQHYELLRKHEARPGDLVVALLGDELPRACVVPQGTGPAIVKADCVRVRANETVASSSYLNYALNAFQTRRRAARMVHGVGRPRLSLHSLRQLELPIAPTPEQHRIVEAIESLFTRLDAAATILERVNANLRRYRASVLIASVEGRLVPAEAALARVEGRDYEPADVLLKRILVERRRRWEEVEFARLSATREPPQDDRWKARYRLPASPQCDLPRLPEGWCWATLEQLSWNASYGTSLACDRDASGVPVVRIPNISDGALDLSDLKFCRTLSFSDSEALAPGDLLIIRTNGSRALIAKAALVGDVLHSPHFFASYLIRFRLVLPEIGRWVLAYWHAPETRRHLEAEAATSAGQYNVSLAALSKQLVPLPPLVEQSRIVTQLSWLDSLAQRNAGVLSTSLQRCRHLRQAVLQWAFEGKLVDQDPSDEPSSVLLERIRTDTAATSRVLGGRVAEKRRRGQGRMRRLGTEEGAR